MAWCRRRRERRGRRLLCPRCTSATTAAEDKRKLVGSTVAQFQVEMSAIEPRRRQRDIRDQVARVQHISRCGVLPGTRKNSSIGTARSPFRPGYESSPREPSGRHSCRRDWWRCSPRWCPGSRGCGCRRRSRSSPTRVRACCRAWRVAEVNAPRALQQVAAGGGHVTQLRRSARQQCLRKHGIIALYQRMMRQIGVADQSPRFSARHPAASRSGQAAGD